MAYDNRTRLGTKLIEGLSEFSDALKSGKPVTEQLTCRKVELTLVAQSYSPQLVKDTRKLLNASQPIFAQFLGVSPRTVQKWERGEEEPQPIACRFMDEIRHAPEQWRARLLECVKPKAEA